MLDIYEGTEDNQLKSAETRLIAEKSLDNMGNT